MKLFKIFLWLLGATIIASIGFLIYIYSEIRHDIKPLIEYEPKLTTTIYDRNGDLLQIYLKSIEFMLRLMRSRVA